MLNDPPKSALELAMERLKKQDEAAGIVERPLTDAQKQAIAETRRTYEAKAAEARILHQPKIDAAIDPAVRAELERELRHELQRIADDEERAVARIRAAER